MAGKPLTWTLDDFGGGIQRRAFAPANTYEDLVDWTIDSDRCLVTRAPVRFDSGTFGPNAMGQFLINGNRYAIRPRGATWDDTSWVPLGWLTLAFDPRPLHDSWVLESWCMLGDTLVVMLACYVGGVFNGLDLHVWDNKRNLPTWVDGYGAPWRIEATNYHPRIEAVGGVVVITGPAGQTWRCAIGNPRIWWEKTADDIAFSGYEYLARWQGMAGGGESRLFEIPVEYAKAIALDRFCGLCVEYLSTSGTWLEVTIQSYGSAANTWGPSQTYSLRLWVQIGAGNGVLYRLRLLPPGIQSKRTPVKVVSGCLVLWENDSTPFTSQFMWTFTGDGKQTRFTCQDNAGSAAGSWYPPNDFSFLRVKVNGVVQVAGQHFTVSERSKTDGTFDIVFVTAPPNGQIVLAEPGMQTGSGGILAGIGCPGVVIYNGVTYPVNANIIPTAANQSVAITCQSGVAGSWVSGIPDASWIFDQMRLSSVTMRRHNGTNPVPLVRDDAWDEVQVQDASALSGDHDAGIIPTGSHSGGAGTVKALVALNNRLLVLWSDACELWAIDPDPTQDRFLDASAVGISSHTLLKIPVVKGHAVVPTAVGISLLSVGGPLDETLKDTNIAEGIIGTKEWELDAVTIVAGALWPREGKVLLAGTVSGKIHCWVIDPGSKGWTMYRWTGSNALVQQDGMLAQGDRLYCRYTQPVSNVRRLWAYDATVDSAADDVVDNAGEITRADIDCRCQFNLNELGRPKKRKRVLEVDGVARGQVQVRFRLANGTFHHGPILDQNTYMDDAQRRPVRVVSAAVGIELTTVGATVSRVERIGLSYEHMER